MRLWSMASWLGLAVVITAVPACKLQYNGAFDASQRDEAALAAYHGFLEERDLALAQDNSAKTAEAAQAGLMMNRSGTVPSANLPLRPTAPRATLTEVSVADPQRPQSTVGNLEQRILAAGGVIEPDASPQREARGNVRRVTYATEGSDFDPIVTPDGQYLIFASTRHRATADLYMKRVNSSAVTQLTSDPGKDVMPAISPDGKTIAFTSSRAGNWDIYLMDVAGGQPIQLTYDPADEIHPSFSPDGKWLVYCRFADLSGQWELVLLELANPSVKRFIGYGLFPNWSPTDDRIVFQRARERGTRFYSVWTIDLVDGEAMRPTEVVASANAAAITPDWSPNGKHIVFCTVVDDADNIRGRGKQSDIWVVDVDGRNRVSLTRSGLTNLQPVWAADGTIYYTSSWGLTDGENIWSLRPDRALQLAARARPADAGVADAGGTALPEQSTAEVTE